MLSVARWSWRGWGRFTVSEHDAECPLVLGRGGCRCRPRTQVEEVPNLIVDVGRNLARDCIRGAVGDFAIHYCALGTSSTAVGAGDTALAAEGFRKVITRNDSGATGEGIVICYVAPGDPASGAGAMAIQEVGWFAGSGASGTANSGVMVSRLLWSHNKTALESLQLEHHDLF